MNDELMDVLGRFTQQLHYSAGQVAALSGVPRRTVMNWLNGRVRRPHDWRRLVQVAAALRLNEADASELLQSAGHLAIAKLRQEVTAVSDQKLLTIWPDTSGAPFQAIADLPYFAGRDEILVELGEALRNGRSVTLHSLRGMGGVGKTALAAHIAYQLRPAFPDGVLWARLDTSDTMSILTSFAAAYGEDVSQHGDLATRATAVRRILADKQALIVLDNAQKSEQVRPLLPPTTGKTAVILTTRHDLAVSDEMRRFLLTGFASDGRDSLAVFTHFLGAAAVRRWRSALRDIADLLGHLPLAIAIAAGQLAAQVAIPDYLAQLQAAHNRLDPLIREDRSVRLSFDLSYHALSDEQKAFFAGLGAFNGDDFTIHAAAYVTNVTETDAENLLGELVHYSLAQPSQNGRFTLHPLLRAYAYESLTSDWPLRRMAVYFVDHATRHVHAYAQILPELSNLLFALETASQMPMPDVYCTGVINAYPTWNAYGLWRTAVPYLQKALKTAQDRGSQQHQAAISNCLGSSYRALGNPEQANTHHLQGLQIAYQIEDIDLIAQFLHDLGVIAGAYYGDYDKAKAYFLEALPFTRQSNDSTRTAQLYTGLANVAYEQGSWREAENYWLKAVSLLDTVGDETSPDRIRLRQNLGVVAMVRGDFDTANRHLTEALTISRELAFQELISTSLSALSQIAIVQKMYDRAETLLIEALAIARDIHKPETIAQALCHLGYSAVQSGKTKAAGRYLQEALTVTRTSNIIWLECEALFHMGDMLLGSGDLAAAHDKYAAALEIANSLGMKELKAFSLYGLAQSGDEHAVQRAQESLALLTDLGHFQAEDVRNWLQEVGKGINA